MTSLGGAPPMRWLNERCTLFSPAVYGPDFRMRCNHAGCWVRVAEDPLPSTVRWEGSNYLSNVRAAQRYK